MDGTVEEALVRAGVLAAAPDHAGLFLGAEAEFLIEAWRAGAEPEEFDSFQAGMMEDALDEFGADPLSLIGLVDDDVPDRRTVDIIGQHPPKPDQSVAIPRTDKQIRVRQHLFGIGIRAALGPGRLVKETGQLRGIEFARLGKGNGRLSLEGRGHSVLQYLPFLFSTDRAQCKEFIMTTQVRSCPKCFQLMWLKENQYELLGEETIRAKCPHCGSTVRFKLVSEGANATGPKMGH